MAFKDIGKKINLFIRWAGSIGIAQYDSVELKSHKTILTFAVFATMANQIFFSFVYVQMGREKAALTLAVYSTICLFSLIYFRIHKDFKIFRNITFVSIYLYIIVYHSVMGGYIGSVGYMIYGVPALLGVHMFYERRSIRNIWLVTFIISALVLYVLEPYISKGMVPLSEDIVLLTLVNNFILMAIMVVFSTNYYTNIIRAEKLKSDNLIRNILPDSVVNELNTFGKSQPILATNATTIFMDFVGFTIITREMKPDVLVSILNDYFTTFDQIFLSHNVEKLKTIGDGYMAVGGLPIANNTHQVDVALAAMKILKFMEQDKKDKMVTWPLRIGIHTGPMVAGIIGETKFSYDVWGSTVNLCARLESTSSPGCINVSHEFMEYTRDFFEFESRGFVEIKNGDPMRMYYLKDLKDELKSDVFTPNDRFFALYNQYASSLR